MARQRILSTTQGPWGKAHVFETGSQIQIEEAPRPLRPTRLSILSTMSHHSMASVTSHGCILNLSLETMEGDNFELPDVLAILYTTVLEDAVNQLTILGNCNTEMQIERVHYDCSRLECLRLGVAPMPPGLVNEIDNLKSQDISSDKFQLIKMDEDRELLLSIVGGTVAELWERKSFKYLHDKLTMLGLIQEEELQLEQEEILNRRKCRELSKELRRQRVQQKSHAYETERVMDQLKTDLEDASLNASIRCRHVATWQNARCEQHGLIVGSKEAIPSDAINDYKVKIDQEQRVHSEIELAMNIEINDFMEKVEEWMDKYDHDLEEIDLEIQRARVQYQTMRDKRIDLEQTIELHDEEMSAWDDFKVKRQKRRDYEARMWRSSLALQCWWRGLLVRRQLGPYKPKKKPKAKKK